MVREEESNDEREKRRKGASTSPKKLNHIKMYGKRWKHKNSFEMLSFELWTFVNASLFSVAAFFFIAFNEIVYARLLAYTYLYTRTKLLIWSLFALSLSFFHFGSSFLCLCLLKKKQIINSVIFFWIAFHLDSLLWYLLSWHCLNAGKKRKFKKKTD